MAHLHDKSTTSSNLKTAAPNSRSEWIPCVFTTQRFQQSAVGLIGLPPSRPHVYRRSSLENALIVASLLNRTLIIPPIYLGHAGVISWRDNQALEFALRQVETTNYNRLFFSDTVEEQLKEFISPNAPVAIVPWSALFDLSQLPENVRVVEPADFVDMQVLQRPEDIWNIHDGERYAYRVFDMIPGGQDDFIFDNVNNDPSLSGLAVKGEGKDSRWLVVNNTYCLDEAKGIRMHHYTGFVKKTNTGRMHTDSDTVQSYYGKLPIIRGWKSRSWPSCNSILPELHHFEPMIEYMSAFNETEYGSVTCFPMAKAAHVINLAGFKKAFRDGGPKLIFFGSLFGRYRLHLFDDKSRDLRTRIGNSLIYQHRILNEVADAIVDRIGGPGAFIAAHIRAGDGNFVQKANRVVRDASLILEDWQKQLRDLEAGDIVQSESVRDERFSILYLATDHKSPGTAEMFEPMRNLFPTVMTILEFPDILQRLSELDTWRQDMLASSRITPGWESEMTLLLDEIEMIQSDSSAEDALDDEETKEHLYASMAGYLLGQKKRYLPWGGISTSKPEDMTEEEGGPSLSSFARLWIPFVDQLVCGKSRAMVGTASSTFTDYIERLYLNYWESRILPEMYLFTTV